MKRRSFFKMVLAAVAAPVVFVTALAKAKVFPYYRTHFHNWTAEYTAKRTDKGIWDFDVDRKAYHNAHATMNRPWAFWGDISADDGPPEECI